jgi:mannan endo-1,4-beta-mannosidase
MSSESTTAQRERWKFWLTIDRRSRILRKKELGATTTQVKPPARRISRRTATWVGAMACVLVLICAAILVAVTMQSAQSPNSTRPIQYLGVYERDSPGSYTGVSAFTAATGVSPDVDMYYSSWLEPFQAGFAASVAKHGAVPLVQINPTGVSLASIAAGQYDSYLTTYAEAVGSYRRPVILGFGHEMNGDWYSWGYRHTSPAVFVAAWRHIVTVFRGLGVRNVTWLWTTNIMVPLGGIPSPSPWWPGKSYVTWVGIDGYYYNPSLTFATLFGPTIAAVRELTRDPILIAETAASPATDQAGKIADLFSGIRLYGLLGFVWFDAFADRDWRLNSPAARDAFHRGAATYKPRS